MSNSQNSHKTKNQFNQWLPIVAINGGLGNQLFQWFFAHSLTPKNKFRLDFLFEKVDSKLGQREFRLESVTKNCEHVLKDSKGGIKKLRSQRFWHLMNHLWLIPPFRTILQNIGYYRENPNQSVVQSKNLPTRIRYAYGYFQNHNTVENSLLSIQRELLPVIANEIHDVRVKFQLDFDFTVIHIRRYITEGLDLSPVHFCNLSLEYFTSWRNNFPDDNVIILTEDASKISNFILALNPKLVLDSKTTTPWETLAIMAASQRLLGSNSSLSWWGAWISCTLGGEAWLPSNWSYWGNVENSKIHFPRCRIAPSSWDLIGFNRPL